MTNITKTEAVISAVAAALASASSVSLVDSALANGYEEVKLQTTDGLNISISRDGNGVIKSGDKIIDAAPSGTFLLPKGQNLVLDKGKVIGGSAEEKRYAWAAFALKPADRRVSRPAEQLHNKTKSPALKR